MYITFITNVKILNKTEHPKNIFWYWYLLHWRYAYGLHGAKSAEGKSFPAMLSFI